MWTIAEVDAIKEFGGVIISSPLLTPRAIRPQTRASVPLFKAIQNLVLQNLATSFSKLSTISPPIN